MRVFLRKFPPRRHRSAADRRRFVSGVATGARQGTPAHDDVGWRFLSVLFPGGKNGGALRFALAYLCGDIFKNRSQMQKFILRRISATISLLAWPNCGTCNQMRQKALMRNGARRRHLACLRAPEIIPRRHQRRLWPAGHARRPNRQHHRPASAGDQHSAGLASSTIPVIYRRSPPVDKEWLALSMLDWSAAMLPAEY